MDTPTSEDDSSVKIGISSINQINCLPNAVVTSHRLSDRSDKHSFAINMQSSDNIDSNAPKSDEEDENSGPELVEDAVNAPVGPMPTVSSKINFPKEKLTIKHDLWICGAGTIGEDIVKAWKGRKENDKSLSIIAETRSDKRHETLSSLGATPRLRESRSTDDLKTAKNVIIAIPPSAGKTGYDYKSGYIDELSEATRLWAGPEGGGSLVFTSSVGVYGDLIAKVTEKSQVDSRSQKATNLLVAEEAVLTRGGAAVRLAGLYLAKRGPHSYWMTLKTIDSPADGLINMVHYEDAAKAVVLAALYNAGKVSSALDAINPDKTFQPIFLVSDDKPLTRKEICEATLQSGLYPDASMPSFTVENGPRTKTCDSSYTRQLLKWKPKYKSFSYYMRNVIGGLPDTEPELEETKKAASSLWIPGDNDDDGLIDFNL